VVNAALVAGCALGGGVIGAGLDTIAARIPPADRSSDASAEGPGVQHHTPDPPGLDPVPVGPFERVAAPGLTALLWGAAAWRIGAVPELAAYCVLFAGLVAMSVVDLRVALVPRRLLYPTLGLTAVALLGASIVGPHWGALGRAGLGGAIGFVVFFAVWWVYPKGLGFGDVRLAGLIGLGLGWLGLLHVYIGFAAAFSAGALFGLAVMAVRGAGRRVRFPFAPALALGAVISVLWGSTVIDAWLHHGS
jgi:prepilin signal peptidase PulO-like enzyme (type II secretory pathway)